MPVLQKQVEVSYAGSPIKEGITLCVITDVKDLKEDAKAQSAFEWADMAVEISLAPDGVNTKHPLKTTVCATYERQINGEIKKSTEFLMMEWVQATGTPIIGNSFDYRSFIGKKVNIICYKDEGGYKSVFSRCFPDVQGKEFDEYSAALTDNFMRDASRTGTRIKLSSTSMYAVNGAGAPSAGKSGSSTKGFELEEDTPAAAVTQQRPAPAVSQEQWEADDEDLPF